MLKFKGFIRLLLVFFASTAGIFLAHAVFADTDVSSSTNVIASPKIEVYSTGTSTLATPFCVAVFYSDWSVCQESFQARSVTNMFPAGCILSNEQTSVMSQKCTSTKSVARQEVLGSKIFANNVLVRGSDKRIYNFENDKLTYIPNLSELGKYSGQKIFNVGDEVIASYMPRRQVAGAKEYANGSLIRGSNKKVYYLSSGKKEYVINLEELAKYHFGKEIFNVGDEIVASFEEKI
jgi:hypothetical protein